VEEKREKRVERERKSMRDGVCVCVCVCGWKLLENRSSRMIKMIRKNAQRSRSEIMSRELSGFLQMTKKGIFCIKDKKENKNKSKNGI
jgi:hypothetical protein